MTGMFQVTATWTGMPGQPGYTNLYFIHSDPPSTGAQNAVNNVRTFFAAVSSLIPSVVSIQVSPTVKVMDDSDGGLTDIISVATAPTAVAGGAAGSQWSGPVGACVDWDTAGLHGYTGEARRVRGRTFLVPLGAVFDAGSLNDSFVTTIQTAATALRTATGPTLGIWARPRPAKPLATPPRPLLPGEIFPVVANHVPDKSVVLRSRRD